MIHLIIEMGEMKSMVVNEKKEERAKVKSQLEILKEMQETLL